ncbi:MAG: hypothetical protein AAGF56_02865 [Pseudomonadota bacterium]
MTNDPRQQDFAERLRRIDEKQAAQPKPVQTRATPKKTAPGQEDVRLRNGIIWLIIFGLVGAGGYYGVQAIPQDLKDMFAGGGAAVAEDEAQLPPAVETAIMSNAGPTIASPFLLTADRATLAMSDVVTGFDAPKSDAALGEVIPFARNAQCRMRSLGADEKLYNVRIENALIPGPLSAFSETQMAETLLSGIQTATRSGEAYDLDNLTDGQMRQVDVLVTDTSAPVYLTLQNIGPGVLWNIETAPDVEIAHIAIIGSAFSALARPSDTTTFEGLLVPDFVSPYQPGDDAETRECMVRPWRQPQPDWIYSVKAERGLASAQTALVDYEQGYRAFAAWFRGALGADASENLVAGRDAAHILVGPAPAETFAYRGLEGRSVHAMDTDHLLSGSLEERTAAAQDLHLTLLEQAIGGSVAALSARSAQSANKTAVGLSTDPASASDIELIFRPNPVLRDAFTVDRITADRTVSAQVILDRDDLTSAAEGRVDFDLIPLYAAARAPAILSPLCDDMVADFASACALRDAQVTTNRNGDLLFTGEFGFVPTASLGAITPVENGQLFRTRIDLPYEGTLAPSNDADGRKAVYAQAQNYCDRLREQIGNCVVSQIAFTVSELWITDLETLPPGTNPQRVETEVEFTVFADPATLSQERFAEIVADLVNPI